MLLSYPALWLRLFSRPVFSTVLSGPLLPFCSRPRVGVSAKNKVCGQPCFARFLILCAHVLAGIGERFNRRVEVNAVAPPDLIGRDHESGPGLHCAERATLDARHLYIPGDGVARHPEMMLKRRLGGVLRHQR